MSRPIAFDPKVAAGKPRSEHHDPCPFCVPEELTGILAVEEDRIWLKNKYPVMRGTEMTVVVETADHDGDITNYSREAWRKVLQFSWSKWREMTAERRFQSVILYRNFGPVSGGSIRHPHAQIIGLEEFDYMTTVRSSQLDGTVLWEDGDVRVTLSDDPVGAFREFNFRLAHERSLDVWADRIREVVRYVTAPAGGGYTSYNLFFYPQAQGVCKVVARGVTSPLLVGYGLTQAPVEAERERIRGELEAVWEADGGES